MHGGDADLVLGELGAQDLREAAQAYLLDE
jgi:hypothetical protein